MADRPRRPTEAERDKGSWLYWDACRKVWITVRQDTYTCSTQRPAPGDDHLYKWSKKRQGWNIDPNGFATYLVQGWLFDGLEVSHGVNQGPKLAERKGRYGLSWESIV